MVQTDKPTLFGIRQSNRDFSKKTSWGKNQFNNTFPVALACYMAFRDLTPVYLTLNHHLQVIQDTIAVESIFGQPYHSPTLYFAFERDFTPYQPFVVGSLPRVDLVTLDTNFGGCLQPLEIKLTALPDNSTCVLSDNHYGTELVIRPNTIVYLVLSIASTYKEKRAELLNLLEAPCTSIRDWTDERELLPVLPRLIQTVDTIAQVNVTQQKPLILQSIWKTIGKSPTLHQHCLDIFVWSDWAFTRLFMDATKEALKKEYHVISRQSRTAVWFIKMLYDFARYGVIDYAPVIDTITYNTKNDKAFAVNGAVTNAYMQGEILTQPRITKDDIRQIILNDGHKLLSPERRFDAILFNTPGLFELS